MKYLILALLAVVISNATATAQNWGSSQNSYSQEQPQASITFSNSSDYSMTLRLLKVGIYGNSYYATVNLGPHSSRIVKFGSTSSYKVKIKAVRNGHASYHDGGDFNVTCDSRGYTEGTMSFSMSTYGNGLGPSISAAEFESNN